MIGLNLAYSSIKSLTLSGNAGAHADNIFLVQGPVQIVALWGVVTTILADNLTVAFFDAWDGASTALTLNNGVISLAPPGSLIAKEFTAANTMAVSSSAAIVLYEPATPWVFQPFELVPNGQVPTYIRFRHTSAGVTSGAIRFGVSYIPQSTVGISPA